MIFIKLKLLIKIWSFKFSKILIIKHLNILISIALKLRILCYSYFIKEESKCNYYRTYSNKYITVT